MDFQGNIRSPAQPVATEASKQNEIRAVHESQERATKSPSLDRDNSSTGPVALSPGNNRTNDGQSRTDQSEPALQNRAKQSKPVCRFFNSKNGCRVGDRCRFRHTVASPKHGSQHSAALESPTEQQNEQVIASASAVPVAPKTAESKSRDVIQKPVASLQQTNPREYQILQVTRRYSPTRSEGHNGTSLTFSLQPSDPDFPFELEKGLQCVLTVPQAFPQDGKPSLRVMNQDMPRGFQINVERGFDSLISDSRIGTLLSLLNQLDRNLEKFLTTEKAPTIKIIPHASKPKPVQVSPATELLPASQHSSSIPVSRKPNYTRQEVEEAARKRDADIRQLEARMGRLPLFFKIDQGRAYNVPIQIPRPTKLPPTLQSIKEVTLMIPELYNLEPCTIMIKGVNATDQHGQNVEMAFEKHVIVNKSMTLMMHINHLVQNMHLMAVESAKSQEVEHIAVSNPSLGMSVTEAADTGKLASQLQGTVIDQDRPHMKLVARPPEWDMHHDFEGEESSEEDSDDSLYSHSDEDHGAEVGGATLPGGGQTANTAIASGVSISFPQIELYGIELLEIISLSVTLRCDRCKETSDIKAIKASTTSTTTIQRLESCPKCSGPLGVRYLAEPIHLNSARAGHLDLDSCTVVDMLPSQFSPTCSTCSTTYTSNPGIFSVRGESSFAVCRECHAKMTFKIPEVKFLRVSSAQPSRFAGTLRPRRKRENLGIVSGTELPDRGRCPHYRKSYRWFRFSCCNKVFACDRCHDAKEEHGNEHANRMICGWCSREQNYRPEDCGVCGRDLIGKKGGGFWEGGKGTRDRTKMRRKDTRKFKRIGGGSS